jgi:diguanylate cyclase (GGDEF)-like protein
MLTVTLPTVTVSLIFTWQNTQQKERDVSALLQRQSEQMINAYTAFLKQHLKAVNTLASSIAASESITSQGNMLRESTGRLNHGQHQALLEATITHYSAFNSMVITNEVGEVTHAAPEIYANMLGGDIVHSVENREYFKQTKNTMQPQLSDALVGQGFGTNPILTVSAPIIKDNRFSGITQGAIVLADISTHKLKSLAGDEDVFYVITDATGKVVYASEHFNLPPLIPFSYSKVQNPLIEQIPSLRFGEETYLYAETTNDFGWTVNVLTKPSSVTSVISWNFYVLAMGLSVTFIVLLLIATRISQRLTLPLVNLADHFNDKEISADIMKEAEVSDEMVKVTSKLICSREVMIDFQEQLSEKVQDKTKQLTALNQQLYNLAQKDGLTSLLNRSGFDSLSQTTYRSCIRNSTPVSVVLIDIDDFKQINDTHGHPFGDKCIVAISTIMKEYCKRNTDIIGRYGGEEFIMMLSGGKVKEHHELVEHVHEAIQSTAVEGDEFEAKLTVSIGISSLEKDFSIGLEEMVKYADEQLYISKRAGKNKVTICEQ